VDDSATGSHIFKLDYNDYKDDCFYNLFQTKVSLEGLKWDYNYSEKGKITRASAWYTQRGCKCEYDYGNKSWGSHEFLPWMDVFCKDLGKFLNLQREPNAMNFNRYDSGEQSLGFHSDDEDLFKDLAGESTIVSLSFGAERNFEIKHMFSHSADFNELLKEGDILVMSGRTQHHYKHAIPKHAAFYSSTMLGQSQIRYNITCRFIHRHTDKCKKIGASR
jgi:alkylated DNA repair dioxygenase AlkB